MDLDITIHGDAIEKEFSKLIIEKIPNYNLIWKTFIGHDGFGKMLKSKGLAPNKEYKRVLFAEYHYTILESVIGMHLILIKSNDYTFKSVREMVLQNNDIIAFHAHVGRIRDCIKKIGELFNFNDIYIRFDKWWSERCAVLHNKKLPIAIKEGIYFVLKDAVLIDDNNTVQSWNDFDSSDFDFLSDYLKSTYESIINEINSSLAAIYSILKDEFKYFKFDALDFNPLVNIDFLSGSTVNITPVSSAVGKVRIFNQKSLKKKKLG